MPISLECSDCQRVLQVKDEFSGRRVRCPKCGGVNSVPDSAEAPAPKGPPAARRSGGSVKSGRSKKGRSQATRPWYVRQWHWLVVGSMLILALCSRPGLIIAGLIAGLGVLLTFAAGVAPFLRVFFGAPGTVLTMIVSRSARFDMMRQPDSHPYKVLVRTAFDPTRGLFWRGALLIVAFIPAVFLNRTASRVFRQHAPVQAPVAMRNMPGPRPNPVALHEAVDGPKQAGDAPNIPAPAGAMAEDRQRMDRDPDPAGTANTRTPSQKNVVFHSTLEYQSFEGERPPAEGLNEALIAELPSYLPGSLTVDETAKALRFQHRSRFAATFVAKVFSRHGFKSIRLSTSTTPDPMDH